MASAKMRLAIDELSKVDAKLRKFLASAPECTIVAKRGKQNHFENLARTIVFQQLAGAAASAIWARVRGLVDGEFTPEAVLGLSEEQLRGAGLSRNKMLSVRDLAEHVFDDRLPLERIARQDEQTVISELVAVRGIGEWTAQMYLMSQLGKLDIWPTGDLGVRAGYAAIYGLPKPPTPKELESLGDKFRPYRSVAAWYCWRAADTITPEAPTKKAANKALPKPTKPVKAAAADAHEHADRRQLATAKKTTAKKTTAKKITAKKTTAKKTTAKKTRTRKSNAPS